MHISRRIIPTKAASLVPDHTRDIYIRSFSGTAVLQIHIFYPEFTPTADHAGSEV